MIRVPGLRTGRQRWLLLLLFVYLLLTCYQLGLPGLHYDEAREAGLNALELLTGAPVTAFRQVTFSGFGLHLPVMVQDYIGALNVYLALPILWISGIGVPNLRIVAVLTGVATLLLVERAVTAWAALVAGGFVAQTPQREGRVNGVLQQLPLSLPGLLALTLLAASPSFIFWSRQGIFVTNLTQPLTFWCLWQGVRWLQHGRRRALLLSAFAGGFALYAKLLAIWVVGPFVLFAGSWWLWQRWRQQPAPPLSLALLFAAGLAFVIPLAPFLFFNWQSGGTWQAVTGNLDTSYYGVANWDIVAHVAVRSRQLAQTLQGSHLWYLGALYRNPFAPWLALVFLSLGLWRGYKLVLGPLLLLLAGLACSLFTISDLFITHYALLQPLLLAVVALAMGVTVAPSRPRPLGFSPSPQLFLSVLLVMGAMLWVGSDLTTSVRYHRALARSGGLADHSDASYHLAYHLRYNGLGAPLALDWGFDAPIRYLSEGTVTPIELFGYASPAAPDPEFARQLHLFLGNPANVYLLHTPAATIFQGRREQFFAEVANAGFHAQREATFTQRDGTPIIELWRVLP